MKSVPELHIEHSPAWRAFWIKVQELNAREINRLEEKGESDITQLFPAVNRQLDHVPKSCPKLSP